MKLLTPVATGGPELKNRIAMAPMTRCRAGRERLPNDLMRTYYKQRAGAGLIISEGTHISGIAIGYTDTPGIYEKEQVEGWKRITEAVHEAGGKIFCQLWHCGRISHPDFHGGRLPVAPSAVNPGKKVFTYEGLKESVVPREMTIDDIRRTTDDYTRAALNAIEAGFDGIELHGANGYLINEFICDGSNLRTDDYGGPAENRIRFALEVTDAVSAAIGSSRTAIRLSPSGIFNGMSDSDPKAVFGLLVRELDKRRLAYLHLMEIFNPRNETLNLPANYLADGEVTKYFRSFYSGCVITNTGYDPQKAESCLQEGHADIVAFGKLFVSNPDLPQRIERGAELASWDAKTFYTAGEKGYTDYPCL